MKTRIWFSRFGFLVAIMMLGLMLAGRAQAQALDTDGDGLSDDDETNIYFTDPFNPDTDGDGLTDGEEVLVYLTDPLNDDTDDDGLTDGQEITLYATDPLDPDMDNDGLTDGEEVLTYLTDPNAPDSDGDGLSDGQEVLFYFTDPNILDTDDDGLTDGEEVSLYSTDPLDPDMDLDLLTDGQEVLTYFTDPFNPDTDGDGLTDGEEVLVYFTNPWSVDTDADGMTDSWEINNGRNPLVHDMVLGGTLNPTNLVKYEAALVIPPAMPPTATQDVSYFEIAVRQFQQQILPTNLPVTTVWSYGSRNHAGTFNYPAFTIEAKVNEPVRVKWINDLKDPVTGNYLPHLLAVDPTLHWANPPQPVDSRPVFTNTPEAYTGPVPIVTHVHGAHSGPESDGYPEAWWLPAASNIPAGYATHGSRYRQFDQNNTEPGTAVFQYPNDQRAATLWYHDHALGMTRLNVYAGPAGFFLLRGGTDQAVEAQLPGPAPKLGDQAGQSYYEIPIVVQDRSFNADASLFFPTNRAFFDGFNGPFIPFSDMAPIHNPEFFGNTMVVNGKSWPVLNVEPRRYRFRLLDGCNARALILKIVSDPLALRPVAPALSFWQIGNEGGFLPAVTNLDQLLIAPAERADVIVDFSGLTPGDDLYVINEGPDSPFEGGVLWTDYAAADPLTSGQVMKFHVVPSASTDTSTPADQLVLPSIQALGPAVRTRQLSLNELDSAVLPGVGPRMALLGLVDPDGVAMPMMWDDAITEKPHLNDTEIWEIYNFTEDAHPIHLHSVTFEVVNREDANGVVRGPEAWELGRKDTVIAYPDEITRIKAKFDRVGRYVWHCHIIDHEDNEMMRPYEVISPVKHDFDADGKADPALYNMALGSWSVLMSGSGYASLSGQFGGPDYIALAADFNGDGKSDPVVCRTTGGAWTILLSQPAGNYLPTTLTLGGAGSKPLAVDFDGDQEADPTVYNADAGQWQVLLSTLGGQEADVSLGGVAQVQAAADYDGDDKADPAVFDSTTGLWMVLLSDSGYAAASVNFGGSGMTPVPADYDGDSKADPAVYQESTGFWNVLLSGSDYFAASANFGGPGMPPSPADYDADGKADPAVYQASSGQWKVLLSGSSYTLAVADFGGPGMTPVQ